MKEEIEAEFLLGDNFLIAAGASTNDTEINESNINLYEATEFRIDNQFEGGLRVGYINDESGWEVAAFRRNITDEDNVLGAIDFSNLTGFVNEPRIWGVEVRSDFAD